MRLGATRRQTLSLVDEISAWEAKYGGAESAAASPFTSESFGGYSYSKSSGSSNNEAAGGGDAGSWQRAYASREALLERLSEDLYRDAMALDTRKIAGGATTATQIRAAYEPLNSKTDEFEYCVFNFLDEILAIAGIEGEKPTFTRSMLLNRSEEIQSVIQAAQYLDGDYVTRKLLTIEGDGDMADEMIEKMHTDELERYGMNDTEPEEEQE